MSQLFYILFFLTEISEIPDAEADAIQNVNQAIDYIAKTPEAH